jgi:hypothetical protein
MAAVVIGLLIVLVSAGACRSSNGPDERGSEGTGREDVSAADAAGTVADVFSVPDDQRACLEQQFADRAEARAVFGGQGVASAAALRALGEVEAACIPIETLALAITGGVDDGFGGTLTDEQKTCLGDQIQALDVDDRDRLLVGLVVSTTGALDDAGIAELGQVTSGLLAACDLDLATTETAPTTIAGDAGTG